MKLKDLQPKPVNLAKKYCKKRIHNYAYFVTGRKECPFALDDEREVTRLWDGSVITGLFDPEEEVEELTRQEAVEQTEKFRRILFPIPCN